MINFNVYCYNVQPGVSIDYSNGKTLRSDEISEQEGRLAFVVDEPNENNPDLIYEMQKYLEIIFENHESHNTYDDMMKNIETIATEARAIVANNDNEAKKYAALKACEYRYLEVLKVYVPILLKDEEFFKSAFKK
ncbi:MAG: hypothetical protein Q4B01_08665 [Eubacteriales bacterium]|nr:hypothetical protein [Eubacteriales bacterium]